MSLNPSLLPRDEAHPVKDRSAERLTGMLSMWKLGCLNWRKLLKCMWIQFWEDRISDQSAKLSFYFLLSLFPLLLFLIALLGRVLRSRPVLQEVLHKYLAAAVPETASGLIDTTLQEITTSSGRGKLLLGLLLALWAASRGTAAILEALNITYEIEESRPWWKKHLIALGLTIVSVAYPPGLTFCNLTMGRTPYGARAVPPHS